MKIATYNVNGIGSRQARLLEWLARESPDVVCLQELKAPDDRFPAAALRQAGYGAIWHGQRRGTASRSSRAAPTRSRSGVGCRAIPTTRTAATSRRRSTACVVGCLYLPNGNPQPGPKFDYKLAWFERLIAARARCCTSRASRSCSPATSTWCRRDFDIYNPKSWRKDALLQPESRAPTSACSRRAGSMHLRTLHPDERIYTFWDYFRKHWPRNAGLRIDHLLLSSELAPRLLDADVDRGCAVRPARAITPPRGCSSVKPTRPRRRGARERNRRAERAYSKTLVCRDTSGQFQSALAQHSGNVPAPFLAHVRVVVQVELAVGTTLKAGAPPSGPDRGVSHRHLAPDLAGPCAAAASRDDVQIHDRSQRGSEDSRCGGAVCGTGQSEQERHEIRIGMAHTTAARRSPPERPGSYQIRRLPALAPPAELPCGPEELHGADRARPPEPGHFA